jgi:hypothetical protein
MQMFNSSWRNFLVCLVILSAMAGRIRACAQEALPRKVSLIAEFQKLGLPPRIQGERDTCSLFAITALAEY